MSYKEGMRVPARIYATEKLLGEMDDGVFDQVTNAASLPGILNYAFCMPDGHWGYGFPIGGVAAMDAETGVISPGGIGFDINFDTDLAKAFGVDIPKQVVVMFHCGSRGFGHQVATDYPVYSRRKRERINGGIRGKILWRHGFPFHWSQDHWAAAKQP